MGKQKYAGFWIRLVASLIDFGTILVVYSIVITITVFLVGVSGSILPVFLGILLVLIATILYQIGMEVKFGATLGKMALGLVVTDYNGNNISIGKSTGRYFGKLLSGFIFGIGYIMIAGTAQKQGLHDMMAGCLVLKKSTLHQMNTITNV